MLQRLGSLRVPPLQRGMLFRTDAGLLWKVTANEQACTEIASDHKIHRGAAGLLKEQSYLGQFPRISLTTRCPTGCPLHRKRVKRIRPFRPWLDGRVLDRFSHSVRMAGEASGKAPHPKEQGSHFPVTLQRPQSKAPRLCPCSPGRAWHRPESKERGLPA